MSTFRLPLVFPAVLLVSCLALAQGHGGAGGGGGSHGATTSTMVNPTANMNGAIATGTGNNGDVSIVHLNSVNDEPKVEFRSQTVLIQVPVVVTDKSGSHLHGLNKEDFTILENGKPQKVSAFEELTASNVPVAAPAAAAPVGQFRNLALDGSQPRNIVVIALDTVNTPFLDQTYGRRELIKYLANNVNSGQVLALMIITSHGLKVVQGLSGDPAKLVATLKRVSGEIPTLDTLSPDAQTSAFMGESQQLSTVGGPSSGSGDPVLGALNAFVDHGDAIEAQFVQQNAIETTMNGFLGIAWSLSGVPGRKSLIWATGGFPFAMDSPSTVPGGYLSLLYERTMLALNQAEISVYPVDVRGLVSNSVGAASQSGAPRGTAAARQLTNRMWLNQAKLDTLNDFADMTGGKAFYNTNDLAGSFKRAADDGSSYYMLSYYLDTSNDKSGWRKLQVKVGRKDVDVRARNGFFVTNATMNPLLSRDRDMANALHSPIEGTGVPVTVQWVGLAPDGDKKKAVFSAHMAAGGLSFDTGGHDQLNFDFAAVAYDMDGKQAGLTARNYAPVVPENQLASVKTNGMDFRNALELAPGKYTVRFVVRDNVTGKVGSVTAPLTVN
jgi:VWFA-related protein